jgi:hypothetical protein
MENKKYNFYMLIDDLKEELRKIAPPYDLYKGKITDQKIGIILGKSKNHINYIKSQLNKSPNYKITLNLLETYKLNLKSQFSVYALSMLKFIDRYRCNNDYRRSSDLTYTYHPNFKSDYFNKINTKEKAYWLGFLYADGYLEFINAKISRLGIEINKKDEILIERFAKAIGFNLKYKHYRKRNECVYIRLANMELVNDLKSHGLMEKKCRKLRLPRLNNYELYLAFLLGYYDGDGNQGSTAIVSSNLVLLEQIKQKFNVPYRVRSKEPFKDKYFYLTLGVELFNKMMDNYELSLPRKRRRFMTTEERIKKTRIIKTKFNLTREDLQKLIQKMSIEEISQLIRVAPSTITYYCKKWHI